MTTPIHQHLLNVVEAIDRPGTFCVSGSIPLTLPGLEVAGVGEIAVPLDKRGAAALKKHARQAPYGKGTQTVVDTKVRRVWEVDAEDVTLGNPEWRGVVDQAVRQARSELGLEKQKLTPHLYKLLLYEPGSFFLSHRDGEKLDRMVATLVITLPSLHEGGELIVRHDGQECNVDFAPKSKFGFQFAAFYADCEHEIKPVTSGYRLSLVYNLTLGKTARPIKAPTSSEHVEKAATLLRAWREQSAGSADGNAPTKLAVLLDHQYTKSGLRRDALKGIDRVKADVLLAAAAEAGFDASLALVTLWQSGQGESSDDRDYGFGYGSRRHHARWDEDELDDDDDAEDSDAEYTMEDVYDSSLSAEHFTDADGKPLSFDKIPLDENELVSARPLSEGKPDKEEFEGYTGNAGMTLERWYHRAAVMLWPTDRRFDVLCEAGVDAAVGGLTSMVRKLKRATKAQRDALKQECIAFATQIIGRWSEKQYSHNHYRPSAPDDITPPPTLLSQLGVLAEPALIAAFIRQVVGRDAAIEVGDDLVDLCKEHGWLTFADDLRGLMAGTTNDMLERHAAILAAIALRKDKNADRRSLASAMADSLMTAVEAWDPRLSRKDYEAAPVDFGNLLPLLVKSFVAVEKPELLGRLVTFVEAHPKPFNLTKVQVPVLLGLAPWLKSHMAGSVAPLDGWLEAVRQTLEARVAEPPQKPADWRRASGTGCTCDDCKALVTFLKVATLKEARFPLAERRRQHLVDVIRSKKLDLETRTGKHGRPYALVCTKTTASYDRALEAHHVDIEQLAKIREMIAMLRE